ncbi:MAG: acyl-CoA dehydrogenase [Microbacteriaceae bacterium]|nr:acyl-CoA dehydrogenase [Microbacteriaceae bacterium]
MPEENLKLDVAALRDALLGKWAKERLESRAVASEPAMHNIPGLTMAEHRERVLQQLHELAKRGTCKRAFPVAFGGDNNQGGHVAAFEEMVYADPSLQIKSGVQWGLFGSAIAQLGTEEHHKKWLPDVLSLKLPGAFAMTEIGHGSDVASIATTATFDRDTDEFVIHTPFAGATKEFLGNAALHGRAAVVFAQLITRGVNYGVHAFFVPIRDENGEMLPGVTSEDDGIKGGLNGIDNGRLRFDSVRVPRINLLNRYGSVDEKGKYFSPIASPGRRFFTMLSALVQGRVSLDGAAVNIMKLALHVALKYGNERRQFVGVDGKETVLNDYGLHQRRLLPRLAQTFAMQFAHERMLHVFDEVFSGANDSEQNREELETIAAALKPMSTWAALDVLQEAREACGGAGYMAKNRLTLLRQDLDIFVTFEGDNHVLLKLVGKRLLNDYIAKFKGGGQQTAIMNAVRFQVVGQLYRFGLRHAVQNMSDFGQKSRSVDALKNTSEQRELLTHRVEATIIDLANALNEAKKQGTAETVRVFNEKHYLLVSAAKAHAELLQWEAFTEALNHFEGDTLKIMTWLRDLFVFGIFARNSGWYLQRGLISAQRAETIDDYIGRLCSRLRPHISDLVDSFGLTPQLVRAEIATGIEERRQSEAIAYYESMRAAGRMPISEKDL